MPSSGIMRTSRLGGTDTDYVISKSFYDIPFQSLWQLLSVLFPEMSLTVWSPRVRVVVYDYCMISVRVLVCGESLYEQERVRYSSRSQSCKKKGD